MFSNNNKQFRTLLKHDSTRIDLAYALPVPNTYKLAWANVR